MGPGYEVEPESLNDNANLLVELAGVLGAGRPDHELSRRGCAPASPEDLGAEIRGFADFASDRYQDLVALLAALSTKLHASARGYATVDKATANRIDQYLTGALYVPPSQD
jgi:hypothetical protein